MHVTKSSFFCKFSKTQKIRLSFFIWRHESQMVKWWSKYTLQQWFDLKLNLVTLLPSKICHLSTRGVNIRYDSVWTLFSYEWNLSQVCVICLNISSDNDLAWFNSDRKKLVKLYFGLEMNSGSIVCNFCCTSITKCKCSFLLEWLDVTKLTLIQTIPCVWGGTMYF